MLIINVAEPCQQRNYCCTVDIFSNKQTKQTTMVTVEAVLQQIFQDTPKPTI